MLITALALSLALIQDPTTSTSPSQPDTAAQTTDRAGDQGQDNGNEVICRRETVSGTNRRERVCMSRDRWQQRQEELQARQRDVQTPDSPRGG